MGNPFQQTKQPNQGPSTGGTPPAGSSGPTPGGSPNPLFAAPGGVMPGGGGFAPGTPNSPMVMNPNDAGATFARLYGAGTNTNTFGQTGGAFSQMNSPGSLQGLFSNMMSNMAGIH